MGANYQIGAFVLGVEADGDWADVSGAGTFTAASFCAGGCLMRNGWLATVRGRAGYAIDRILVYGTAGGAFGEVQAGFSNHTASRSTEPGWTAGAGVEYAVLPNLTAKFEVFVRRTRQRIMHGGLRAGPVRGAAGHSQHRRQVQREPGSRRRQLQVRLVG